jgi:hypothetical protein
MENTELSFERWDRMDPENGLPKLAENYLSIYVNKIENELIKIIKNRPSKITDSQNYYLFKAREAQIHYECAIIKSGQEFLHGNFLAASLLCGRALHHLQRRTKYEEKVYKIWLERIKTKENPPTPDIMFINHGIRLNQLI